MKFITDDIFIETVCNTGIFRAESNERNTDKDIKYVVNSSAITGLIERLGEQKKGHRPQTQSKISFWNIYFIGGIEAFVKARNIGFLFQSCVFDSPVSFSFSELNHLIFRECYFYESLKLHQIRLNSNLAIMQSTIWAGVDLEGAKISGMIMIQGCQIHANRAGTALADGQPALMIDNATIGLDLELSCHKNSTAYYGTVKGIGLTVKGQIIASDGHFIYPDGKSINLQGATISGDVFLNKNFISHGMIDFHGATVGGQFSLVGACLLSGLEPLTYDERTALGPSLTKANTAPGSQSEPPGKRTALRLRQTTIKQDLLLKKLSQRPLGHIDLSSARVNQLCDDCSHWPLAGTQYYINLTGLDYKAFSHYADTSANCGNAQYGLSERERCYHQIKNSTRILRTANEYRRAWLHKQEPELLGPYFLRQPWVACAKALSYSNQNDQARRMSIDMERHYTDSFLHRKTEEIGKKGRVRKRLKIFRFLRKIFLDHFTRYGHSPYHPFYLLGILIFLAIIYYMGLAFFYRDILLPSNPVYFLSDQYIQNYEPKIGNVEPNYPAFNPILYAIDKCLPVIKLGQENAWQIRSQSDLPLLEQNLAIWGFKLIEWGFAAYGFLASTLGSLGLAQVAFRQYKPEY